MSNSQIMLYKNIPKSTKEKMHKSFIDISGLMYLSKGREPTQIIDDEINISHGSFNCNQSDKKIVCRFSNGPSNTKETFNIWESEINNTRCSQDIYPLEESFSIEPLNFKEISDCDNDSDDDGNEEINPLGSSTPEWVAIMDAILDKIDKVELSMKNDSVDDILHSGVKMEQINEETSWKENKLQDLQGGEIELDDILERPGRFYISREECEINRLIHDPLLHPDYIRPLLPPRICNYPYKNNLPRDYHNREMDGADRQYRNRFWKRSSAWDRYKSKVKKFFGGDYKEESMSDTEINY